MMLSMFNTLILILAFSLNLNAQTIITNTDRLSWTQSATNLMSAQALSYTVYIDDMIRRSLENVICSGAMSPFSCNSKFPSFISPGIHNLQITATDVAESAKSPIFNIQIVAPSAPSNLGIVNNTLDPEPTIFVDNSLISNCLSTYNPTNRSCGTGLAKAYNTIAGAASSCIAGDVIALRGGTYNVTQVTTISCNGTSLNRIIFIGYKTEQVIIKGPYDIDTNKNGIRNWDEDISPIDGLADGPGAPSWYMINLIGDYITFKRISIEWGYYGLVITGGSHAIIEEVVCGNFWLDCLLENNGGDFNTFRYTVAHHSRHGAGEAMYVQPTDITTNTILYRTLAFKNGRQLPNDAQVLPTFGDSAGGGNSDGIVTYKDCVHPQTGAIICNNFVLQENFMWSNIDGCMDTSIGASALINNIAYNCEGPSYKIFEATPAYHYSGNINIGSSPVSNTARSYELRFNDTAGLGTTSRSFHNLGTRVTAQNVIIGGTFEGSHCIIRNNIMWDGDGSGGEYTFNGCINSNNYDGDTSGSPDLQDEAYNPNSDVMIVESCLQDAPYLVTIKSCWQLFYNAIYNAYKPAIGSSVINTGIFESGFHCPLADDNGQNISSACRHWIGSAPDKGPFEFGIIGNPDKTKCVELNDCN